MTKKKESEPERGGDPFPEPQPYSDTPLRRRLGRRPSLLAILLVLSLSLSSYSALNVSGALRAAFPNTQLFSVGVAYSFGNNAGQVLLPGGVGNVSLTISSAVSQPTTLFLSFNASDPQDWAIVQPSGVGCGLEGRPLLMTLQGVNIAPSNSADLNCNGPPFPVSQVSVTVNQGINTYTGQIHVAASANLGSSFSLTWSASQ